MNDEIKIDLHLLGNVTNALLASSMFCTDKFFAKQNEELADECWKLILNKTEEMEKNWYVANKRQRGRNTNKPKKR